VYLQLHPFVSDLDAIAFWHRKRRRVVLLEDHDSFPGPEPTDVARQAAFRARLQNRRYAPDFVGPIYSYPRERT
jgi:hypothetical protein